MLLAVGQVVDLYDDGCHKDQGEIVKVKKDRGVTVKYWIEWKRLKKKIGYEQHFVDLYIKRGYFQPRAFYGLYV